MLVKYVCSGSVVAMVLEGTKSVEGSRNVIGVNHSLLVGTSREIVGWTPSFYFKYLLFQLDWNSFIRISLT